MRVTFVLPFAGLTGGVRVVATYARALHERGHEVTVISTAAQAPRGFMYHLRVLLGRRRRWEPPARTPLLDFLGERHVVTPLEQIGVADVPDGDVVIATWWETAEWVNPLPPSKGRKFYLLQDYEVFENQPRARVAATFAMDLKKIAVSSYIRDAIRQNHEVQGEIEVVPNAVDLEHFRVPERARNQTFTIGFLYTAAERKNIALAVEALKQLRAEREDFRVLAFGALPVSGALPLPDWISYHEAPDQADIPALYAACDLWLFPTRTEGFGLPILEAMACRTPVLATDAGAAPDLIDGLNGLILDHRPEAFSRAMLDFMEMDPETWKTWSDAAFRTASQNRWEDATDRLLAVLDREGS